MQRFIAEKVEKWFEKDGKTDYWTSATDRLMEVTAVVSDVLNYGDPRNYPSNTSPLLKEVSDRARRGHLDVLDEVEFLLYSWIEELGSNAIEVTLSRWDKANSKHPGRTFNDEIAWDLLVPAYVEELGEIARAMTYDEKDQEHLVEELADLLELSFAWDARVQGRTLY